MFWKTLVSTFLLSLLLSVDDFAEAVGLAVAGFFIPLTVALFKISEVVAVYAGIYLGLFGLARLVTRRLVYVPGLTLLAVAAWQVLQ